MRMLCSVSFKGVVIVFRIEGLIDFHHNFQLDCRVMTDEHFLKCLNHGVQLWQSVEDLFLIVVGSKLQFTLTGLQGSRCSFSEPVVCTISAITFN